MYRIYWKIFDSILRHFDCALAYQNEHEVGKAIRDKIAAGRVKREDLYVTSKVRYRSRNGSLFS